jgi:hypothetical protein
MAHRAWSMIRKNGYRFSAKIMLKANELKRDGPSRLEHDPEKRYRFSAKIMLKQN